MSDISEPFRWAGDCTSSKGVDVKGCADCRRFGVLTDELSSLLRRSTGELACRSATDVFRGDVGEVRSPDFSVSSLSCSSWGSMKLRRFGRLIWIIERLRVNMYGVRLESPSLSVLDRFSLLPVRWLISLFSLVRKKLLDRSILGTFS